MGHTTFKKQRTSRAAGRLIKAIRAQLAKGNTFRVIPPEPSSGAVDVRSRTLSDNGAGETEEARCNEGGTVHDETGAAGERNTAAANKEPPSADEHFHVNFGTCIDNASSAD
jgi:hypothetical protein